MGHFWIFNHFEYWFHSTTTDWICLNKHFPTKCTRISRWLCRWNGLLWTDISILLFLLSLLWWSCKCWRFRFLPRTFLDVDISWFLVIILRVKNIIIRKKLSIQFIFFLNMLLQVDKTLKLGKGIYWLMSTN